MYNLFEICVSFLEWIGQTFQLSYEQISVYFNLYLQGGILICSTLPALIVTICRRNAKWILVSVCNTCVYIVGFIGMMLHYHLPNDISYAFDKCVEDLVGLSQLCHLSYQQVNILIFVVIFLLLMIVNVMLYTVIRKIIKS